MSTTPLTETTARWSDFFAEGSVPAPLHFTVAGAAAPQGSKRHVGHGVMIESSKRVKPWRADVRDAAYEAMLRERPASRAATEIIRGPVRLAVEFAYSRPRGHYRADGVSLNATGRRNPYPPARGSKYGDVSKLLRALEDALTGVVFVDDGQVVDLHGMRVWGPRDEAAVRVLEISAPREDVAA